MPNRHHYIYPDKDTLVAAFVCEFEKFLREAASSDRPRHIALSGGSTPLAIFSQLKVVTSPELWSNVHLYWGDERCVPPGDAESNFGLARERLLDPLKLPDDQKISIAVIKGARAGYIYHLSKPYVLIGRGKVDLIIPDKEISRKHVAVEVRNNKIYLRDLGSTNSTFINDSKVSITEITDQTEFRIGQTTLMLITTSKD